MNPKDPHETMEDLDPELERLFSVERARPTPGDETLERVFSRVQRSIALGPPLAPDEPAPGATEPHGEGSPAGPQVPTELTGATTGAATGAATSILSAGSKWLVAAVFAAGAATGAASHAALQSPPQVQIKEVIRYLEKTSPPSTSPPVPPASPTLGSDEAAQVPRAPTKDRDKPTTLGKPGEETNQRLSRDAELADENLLIERAQTALGRRDPEAALLALRLHKSRYPKGQLSYERDLLEREATRLKNSTPSGTSTTEGPEK